MDIEKLHEKLTQLIVSHRYFEMHPIDVFTMTHQDILDCQEGARKLYQNNPLFHATVEGIVHGILDTIKGHEAFEGVMGEQGEEIVKWKYHK